MEARATSKDQPMMDHLDTSQGFRSQLQVTMHIYHSLVLLLKKQQRHTLLQTPEPLAGYSDQPIEPRFQSTVIQAAHYAAKLADTVNR